MTSLVSQTATYGAETRDKLPELNKEAEGIHSPSHASQRRTLEQPAASDDPRVITSSESLIEALGLAEADEKSLASLLKSIRGEVFTALEELRAITTYDDNLEKQYKEVSSENANLHAALEKARREIRHLKGQLSVLQMTSSEIREERARIQLRERRKAEQEKRVQLQRTRSQYADEAIPVLTAAERARTVNARGEYINRSLPQGNRRSRHLRRATYPPPRLSSPPPSTTTPARPKLDPLPPPLSGCNCSVCNAKQSLGALTLGQALKRQETMSQHTRSGQQILLGDRVIVKGERPGTIRYIGKLDFDILDLIHIGVHLDMPVGTCDGSVKGRRYFQCPPNHGVFVRPSDVMCVTGRKPRTGGTAVPRIRERLPTGFEISRTASRASKTPAGINNKQSLPTSPLPPSSTHTTPTITRAKATVEAELAMLKEMGVNELVDKSVVLMSERMKVLARKSQLEPLSPQMEHSHESAPRTPSLSSPPPRPLTPEPPSPETPPPSPQMARPPTPLETTLLLLLSNKDLGNTGFVTAAELAAALTQLEPGKALTPPEIDQLFSRLGLDITEGGGIPYHQALPQIVHTINSIREEQTNQPSP